MNDINDMENWMDALIGVNIWIVVGIGLVIFALLILLIGRTVR